MPPPTPPNPEHRQPVQEGLARGRKNQHLSVVAGKQCPRQGARLSLLGPAGWTDGGQQGAGERSPASWHGRHQRVPAQVLVMKPGEEGQEGQEVRSGSVGQGVLPFLEVPILLAPTTRMQLSSTHEELSTSCQHQNI